MPSKHSIRTSVPSSRKNHLNLCTFTFSDGRRCRALRLSGHPQFCHFHARCDAEARAVEQLGRDSSYFFSGGYLSACDLSAALGRLFAEVASGHVKPRTATTLAYLAQVLVQTLHLSQNEYIAAFDTDSWRRIINSHVTENAAYLNRQRASFVPPSQKPAPVAKSAPPVPPSHTPAVPVSQSIPDSPPPKLQPSPAPSALPHASAPQPRPVVATPNPPFSESTSSSSASQPATSDAPPTSLEKRPAKTKASSPAKQAEPPTNPLPTANLESPCAFVEVGPSRLPISASVPLKWPWPPGRSPK